MSALITISFTVGLSYRPGDYAMLHGNGGAGDIDWNNPLTDEKFDLFPDGAGIYGWGHLPWGHFPWGHGMARRTAGWGHLPWGHFPWGHSAVVIKAQVEVSACGAYKFGFACYDAAGNLNKYDYNASLVTNGTFDTDTNWTKGSSFSIATGKAHCDGTFSNDVIYQDCGAENGKTYKVAYTISNSLFTGGAYCRTQLGDTNGTARTADGTYEETLTAEVTEGGTISIFARAMNSGDHFSIDDVSVRENISLDQMTTTVHVHIAPAAPTGLKFVSYDKATDILTLAAA